MARRRPMTIGRYLVQRLDEIGVGHVFGVPGDYVLNFMDCIVESPIELVGTCNELNAGYAADAYARINRIGAVCVTYAVGGFSVLNAVAGAYAERVPLIVISGGPSLSDRQRGLLLHHTLGDYNAQADIFDKVTIASVVLTDAAGAPARIDETLAACLRHKRPVFIEIPEDLVEHPCPAPTPFQFLSMPKSDPAALAEAVDEAAAMLRAARRPSVLAGVEIHRFRLRAIAQALIERAGYPFATTLLAKSLINEHHPQFIGIYAGALSEGYVQRTVERADCLLNLGAILTDMTLGIYTAALDETRLINANSDKVRIKHHVYPEVYLKDFISGLSKRLVAKKPDRRIRPAARALDTAFRPRPNAAITIARFYKRLNHFLDRRTIVLADAGDSFLCAGELVMRERIGFICQAFYCSIGFTIPAALGVALADPKRRPVVFVGDGAFQMTAQEISTIIRRGLNPIIFVMNNDGYTVERVIHDGPYNDIQPWRYHKLPEVFGDAASFEVRTEGDLETVLEAVKKIRDRLCLVEVHLDKKDCSKALKRLGRSLARRKALESSFGE
jgi:TPP-dependent 2-oxoacid decarboxylase